MTPDHFQQVEKLFHELVELPPREQARRLDQITDTSVRAEVERLLRFDTRSEPISGRMDAVVLSKPSGTLGRYRLLREIGAGGMGTVFQAETDVDGAKKQVAIKLLHGLPTDSGRRRMRRERALLAALNHPNIATHLDGGETEEGQPYLVMEYVEGQGLADHLAQHDPTVKERLALFLQLADAVAHAHERLVLHRDIKPGNVVVRPSGAPALLDFGVGALLAETSDTTGTQTIAYTPGYGAPEQRRGETATTATDMFGLGALLFDLLTSQRLATLRAGDAPVPLPSQSVSDPTLRRTLRGDLDRIIGKATAEDPARRYRTVQELAEDVRRYLAGLPVRAAPDALLYRASKFVARHRFGVAAGVIGLLAGALLLAQLGIERARALRAEATATREAANAMASRDFLVSVLGATMPEERRGEPITMARLLANAAKALRANTSLSDGSRAAVWLAIADIFDSQGDPLPALAAVDAAKVFLAQNHEPALLAKSHGLRGSILFDLDRHAESKTEFDRFLRLRAALPLTPVERAIDQADYGRGALQWGDFKLAKTHLTRALTLLDQAGAQEWTERTSILRALTTASLGEHDLRGADRYLAQMMAVARQTADDDTQWINYRRVAAQVRLAQGKNDEALRETAEALRLAKRVYGQRSMATGEAENDLGAVLNGMSRYGEAITHMENAQRIFEDLAPGPARLAQSAVNIGAVYEAYGDYARAVEIHTKALPDLPDDAAQTHWHTTGLVSRAYSLASLGRHKEAERDLDAADQIVAKEGAGRDSLQFAWVQLRRTRAHIYAHEFEAAARTLANAEKLYTANTDESHLSRITLARLRILLALEQGDTARAASLNDALIPKAAAHPGMDALWLAQLRLTSAEIAYRQGKLDEARRITQSIWPTLRQGLSPRSPEIAQAARLRERLGSG